MVTEVTPVLGEFRPPGGRTRQTWGEPELLQGVASAIGIYLAGSGRTRVATEPRVIQPAENFCR